MDPLINSCCICLFLPSFLLLWPLAPALLLAASVQIPLLLRGRGGVVVGEGAGERTVVSLSTVLLSPPSATLVSSVWACDCVCLCVGQPAFGGSRLCGTSCLVAVSLTPMYCAMSLPEHVYWVVMITLDKIAVIVFSSHKSLNLTFLKWLCWQESFYPRKNRQWSISIRIL